MLVLFAVSAFFWVLQLVLLLKTKAVLPLLSSLPPGRLEKWPTVSLVVPARDEGATVKEALQGRLSEGYPALEVVFVDDRSTDDTGEKVRALAATEPRLTVTRVDTLLEGWLGKVHALQQGLSVARGEWILFSDADVHLTPGTLQRVIAWAEAEKVDHVCAMPSVQPGDLLTSLSLAAFFRVVVLGGRMWAVPDDTSKAAAGVGAFNLFRRSALERTPGLEWLKMEIADDAALGLMLKRHGAKQRVVIAREAVSLQFYPSYGVMARALEKNGAQLPLVPMLLALSLLVAIEWGWLAGLTTTLWPAALAVGVLTALTGALTARWLGNPVAPALFSMVGTALIAAVLARSSFLAWRRGGVVWRGTFYSTAAVRAGRRML